MAGSRLWMAVIYAIHVCILMTVAIYTLGLAPTNDNKNGSRQDLLWHWFRLWTQQQFPTKATTTTTAAIPISSSPHELWKILASFRAQSYLPSLRLHSWVNNHNSNKEEEELWNLLIDEYNNQKSKNQINISIVPWKSALSKNGSDIHNYYSCTEENVDQLAAMLLMEGGRDSADLLVCSGGSEYMLRNDTTRFTTKPSTGNNKNKIYHHVESGSMVLLPQPRLSSSSRAGGGVEEKDTLFLLLQRHLLPQEKPTLSVPTCLNPIVDLTLLVISVEDDDDNDGHSFVENPTFECWSEWLASFHQVQQQQRLPPWFPLPLMHRSIRNSSPAGLVAHLHITAVPVFNPNKTTQKGETMDSSRRADTSTLHLEWDLATRDLDDDEDDEDDNHRHTNSTSQQEKLQPLQRQPRLFLSDLEVFLEKQEQSVADDDKDDDGSLIRVFLLVQPAASFHVAPLVVVDDTQNDNNEIATVLDFRKETAAATMISKELFFAILPPSDSLHDDAQPQEDQHSNNNHVVAEDVVRRIASWITRRCLGLSLLEQPQTDVHEEDSTYFGDGSDQAAGLLEWHFLFSARTSEHEELQQESKPSTDQQRPTVLPKWFAKLFWHRAAEELYRKSFWDAREAIRRYKAWLENNDRAKNAEETEPEDWLVGAWQPPLPQPLSAAAVAAVQRVQRAHECVVRHDYEQAVSVLLLDEEEVHPLDPEAEQEIDLKLLTLLILDLSWDQYAALLAPLVIPLFLPAVVGILRELVRYRRLTKTTIATSSK
ncbi:hypothetical protein ACA910_022437 [Epithemia clementina (nom. ined.)]